MRDFVRNVIPRDIDFATNAEPAELIFIFDIEKIEYDDTPIVTIADYIYEIPKIKSKERITSKDRHYDLLIEQNNSLGEFRIKLSKELKEKFKTLK